MSNCERRRFYRLALSRLDVQFSDDEFFNALTPAQVQPEWTVVSFGDQLEGEEWTTQSFAGNILEQRPFLRIESQHITSERRLVCLRIALASCGLDISEERLRELCDCISVLGTDAL